MQPDKKSCGCEPWYFCLHPQTADIVPLDYAPGALANAAAELNKRSTLVSASDAELAAEVSKRMAAGTFKILSLCANTITMSNLAYEKLLAQAAPNAGKTVKWNYAKPEAKPEKKCVYVGGSRYCKTCDQWHN